MPQPRGKCALNDKWLTDDSAMSGIHRGSDSSTALCKLCRRAFAILNMGEVLFVPM